MITLYAGASFFLEEAGGPRHPHGRSQISRMAYEKGPHEGALYSLSIYEEFRACTK